MLYYKEYFKEEQIKFVKQECNKLQHEFSIDSFIYLFSSALAYNAK